MLLVVFAVFGMCIFVGCRVDSPHITIKDDVSQCHSACAHVKEHNCQEGNDLVYPIPCSTDTECGKDHGVCINHQCTETCEAVCKAFVNQGRQLGLKCWENIQQCSDIESVCR